MSRSSPDIADLLRLIESGVSIGVVTFDPLKNNRENRYLTDGEIGCIAAALHASLQPATAGEPAVKQLIEAADELYSAYMDGVGVTRTRRQSEALSDYADASNIYHTIPDAAATTRTLDQLVEGITPENVHEEVGNVAQASSVPDGYVLMPREATRTMTMAGCDSLPACEHVFGHAGEMLRNAYRKMVEAAALLSPERQS